MTKKLFFMFLSALMFFAFCGYSFAEQTSKTAVNCLLGSWTFYTLHHENKPETGKSGWTQGEITFNADKTLNCLITDYLGGDRPETLLGRYLIDSDGVFSAEMTLPSRPDGTDNKLLLKGSLSRGKDTLTTVISIGAEQPGLCLLVRNTPFRIFRNEDIAGRWNGCVMFYNARGAGWVMVELTFDKRGNILRGSSTDWKGYTASLKGTYTLDFYGKVSLCIDITNRSGVERVIVNGSMTKQKDEVAFVFSKPEVPDELGLGVLVKK
jgi:hypothetical protein